MDNCSKIVLVLSIFCAVAFAEKKINLEDIERDNLRAESKSDSENIRAQETAYDSSVQPEVVKSKYQQESRRYENDDSISGYVIPQRLQNKYNALPEEYQDVKYLEKNIAYQETPQSVQYINYEQQPEVAASKSYSQDSPRETSKEQFYYRPEVLRENRYQSIQDKTVPDKISKNSDGDTLYVNVPMAQLLSLYPNIGQSILSKDQAEPLLHRFNNQADQQIAIPIYTPSFSNDPLYSNSKISYQIQSRYTPHRSRYHPLITEAILPTKSTSKFVYTPDSLTHRRQPSTQMKYLQEILYSQQPTYVPESTSSHETSVYERPSSSHLESNRLSQNYASQSINQQSYASYDHPSMTNYPSSTTNYAPRVTDHIYQQQSPENIEQDYETIPGAPNGELDLPRLPAKNFKSSNDRHVENHLVHKSEPKSLIDSYIPSHLLAAQNSERYRERPIKLERGFVPSTINYVRTYEKRKIE